MTNNANWTLAEFCYGIMCHSKPQTVGHHHQQQMTTLQNYIFSVWLYCLVQAVSVFYWPSGSWWVCYSMAREKSRKSEWWTRLAQH